MSLADLLVSLAVLSLLLAATLGALEEGQQLHAFGAARVESQQSARVALERMAREVRQAGRGRPGADFPAVSVAEPTRLVVHFDLDGDGVIAGNGETVTWLLQGRVLRRDAGGGAQPIINGVRSLRLTYFDAAGFATADPAAVRAVGIDLVTEPDQVASGRRAEASVSTLVRLRNR
jgi:Tfp pilus assembly protein PilW